MGSYTSAIFRIPKNYYPAGTGKIEQGRCQKAAPSSYGVIIKLSRVETLVINRVDHCGRGFSSC
ncbi:MAG: hypothetical protein ACOYJZ_09025, partial [Acutalibacter sp.]